jgi:ribosomal protein S18 acetylase RimI-like enzyme
LGSDITIRPLGLDDAVAYMTMRLRALRDHPAAFGSSVEEWVEQSPTDVAQRFQSPTGVTLGAFDDGRLIGTTRVDHERPRKMRHRAGIYGVYVAPEARRRGIARALLIEAIAIARGWPEVEEVRLTVSVEMPAARALYAALGFEVWGVEPRALKVDGRYVGEEHMVLRLDQSAGNSAS